MVCFQDVVEIWGVYWFRRRLGRGRREDLFYKVAKGRLKMGFGRPLVGKGGSLENHVCAERHSCSWMQVLLTDLYIYFTSKYHESSKQPQPLQSYYSCLPG